MTQRRIVIVPDIHVPAHDRKALRTVLKFIGETNPDEVVFCGDVMDFPQPSRWSKDTRYEFEGSIFQDVEVAKKHLFGPLREQYSGPVKFIEGNHDERPRVYLDKYSPALSGTNAFNMEVLCDFDGFGIELAGDFYDIAPGWIATHGHRGGIRLNQTAGSTALNAARRFGKSVVMGHTHRLAAVPHTGGYGAKGSNLWGMEVGNLMDMTQAVYLKGATANWQQGFGILNIDGSHVSPTTVPIESKKFVVDGVSWVIQ